MSQELWTAVDDFFGGTLWPRDETLAAALAANVQAGLPAIDVSPSQGRLLYLIARIVGVRRILEVGTLGGYSTICLARALPPDGCLITLEAEPKHAAVAQENLERAGLSARVRIVIGPALTSLPMIQASEPEPFDLVFIDADKPNTPAYFDWAVELARPGTVIIADNVVRKGEVADPASADPNAQGMRQLAARVGANPRVEATAIQTVGTKGHDGFVLARVR